MAEWYYDDGGQQRGPVARQRIEDLLADGTLEPATLVWTEGMPEWQAAESIPGLVVANASTTSATAGAGPLSPYAPPAAAPASAGDVDWSGYVPSGSQVRPWVRYWARNFDFVLFSVVFGAAIGVFSPDLTMINDTLFGIILLFAYNFAEPAMLSIFGTTPFKALLRIRVRNADGTKLSYPQGLRRTISVWVNGQGFGIPLVQFITCLFAHNRLEKEGITSWDKAGRFTVSHQTIPWWRWLLAIAALVGFVTLIAMGNEAAMES